MSGLKLKVIPQFPAQVVGRAGIDLTKSNGTYFIDLDITEFPQIGALPPNAAYALIYDPVAGQYYQAPLSLLGLLEAPTDGQIYGRKNSAWAVVTGGGGGGIPEAPTDGALYGRQSSAWAKGVKLAGDTLTGALILAADPAVALGAATKQYVDNRAVRYDAAQVLTVAQQKQARDNISSVLHGYLFGLTLSTAGASATFSVAAGVAADSANSVKLSLTAALSKTTGAWAVGSANGALDTGAIAASTWYHAHLIQRPDTGVVDVLISLSATAPTLPTNYTLFRRIGSMKTNGSSQWTTFTQNGDEFLWTAPVADVSALAVGSTGTHVLSTPLGVKTNAILDVFFQNTVTAGSGGIIYSPDLGTLTPNAPTGFIDVWAPTVSFAAASIQPRTDTSSSVKSGWTSSASNNLYIITKGWIDRRGRDA